MTTMNSRLIPLTDDRGRVLVPDDVQVEPEPGSVVLTEGNLGTAWQRFFNDGLWYAAGRASSRGRDWTEMLAHRNLVLVYDAPERV